MALRERGLQPWLRGAWLHEFQDTRSAEARFQAAPGYSYVVDGAFAPKDSLDVNTGLKLNFGASTSFFTTFDGRFSEDTRIDTGNAGFKVSW